MREWLTEISEGVVVGIDAMALVVVAVGTCEAFVSGLWAILSSRDGHWRRDVWLRYVRWLIAALSFLLAADIVETAITPSWDDVARLGAIALIRTFLEFVLERDLAELRERQREPAGV
jgi:uncharacterized membrane protein